MKTVFVAGPTGTRPYIDLGVHLREVGTPRRRMMRKPCGSIAFALECLVHEDREEARRVFRQVRAFRARAGRGLPFEEAAQRLASIAERTGR